MCQECGCNKKSEAGINETHPQAHDHDHDPDHPHSQEREHEHKHEHEHEHRTIDVNEAILDQNDRLAERNRGFFKAKGLLVLNVLSSPGSGKTTFLQKTIEALKGRLRVGVMVGDLATENDAIRLRSTGAPAVQITTGTMCHLEAEMVAQAASQLPLDDLDLLMIENVGNLVCPASFDLGEDLRVVLLSVTEGEDKPLKYPPMFHSAHVTVVSKIDLAAATEFNRDLALGNLRQLSPKAVIFEVSAKTGQGMEAWIAFLVTKHQEETQGKQTANERE